MIFLCRIEISVVLILFSVHYNFRLQVQMSGTVYTEDVIRKLSAATKAKEEATKKFFDIFRQTARDEQKGADVKVKVLSIFPNSSAEYCDENIRALCTFLESVTQNPTYKSVMVKEKEAFNYLSNLYNRLSKDLECPLAIAMKDLKIGHGAVHNGKVVCTRKCCFGEKSHDHAKATSKARALMGKALLEVQSHVGAKAFTEAGEPTTPAELSAAIVARRVKKGKVDDDASSQGGASSNASSFNGRNRKTRVRKLTPAQKAKKVEKGRGAYDPTLAEEKSEYAKMLEARLAEMSMKFDKFAAVAANIERFISTVTLAEEI